MHHEPELGVCHVRIALQREQLQLLEHGRSLALVEELTHHELVVFCAEVSHRYDEDGVVELSLRDTLWRRMAVLEHARQAHVEVAGIASHPLDVHTLIEVGHATLTTSRGECEHTFAASSAITVQRVTLPALTLGADGERMLVYDCHDGRFESLTLLQHTHAAQIILTLVTRVE